MKKNKEKKPINKATLVLSIVSGVIALVLIASIFVQFRTVDESRELDIEGMRDDELRTQIASYRSRYEETMEQYNANQNTINEYETAINENQETTELLDQEVEQAKTILGLTDVKGSGVVITLTDTEEALYTYIADDLILLLSELRYAGAEAISINDERIVNTTAITCAGNVILINGNKVGSPFTIKAIGNQESLYGAITRAGGYTYGLRARSIQVDTRKSDNVQISRYTGALSFKYAQNND